MSRAATAPGIASALFVIACMDVLPRFIGLRRSFALLRRQRVSGSAYNRDLVDATVRAVCTAAAFYPRRALCLEQSLALTWLLRRRGVPAELRIGVQPRPFYAHAWVEVGGAPLNEPADLPQVLTPFALSV
jgi:hypothetical protein